MTEDHSNQNLPTAHPEPLAKAERVASVPARWGFTEWLALLLLVFTLLTAAAVRLRLLDFPLERDEGEYAYAGQLIQQGIPPYQLAYNMKMPGTYLAYALIMSLFGQTTSGIHLGLLLVHLMTLAALFLIARKWLDLPGAAVATAAYALMTLSPAYLGLAAHATHFVLLPALLGVWVLLRVEKDRRLVECLLAGCLFGTAFLMKQPGLFFGVFGGLYLGWLSLAGKLAWRPVLTRLGLYAFGCLLPFLVVCLWMKFAGVFPAFWFWTISYAREYADILSFHEGVARANNALALIIHAAPLLWLASGTGLVCLCLTRQTWNMRIFLGGFLVFSCLAVCPGFYFRAHYFILLVPAVALLIGLAVTCSGRWLAQKYALSGLSQLPVLLAVAVCAQSLFADRAVLFFLPPQEACREVYDSEFFPESPAVARYLEQNTRPDQRIVVIGSEPEIYFLAHRHSSTGYIYTYPLMEPQPFARQMQENMIREIEQNPPAGLVLISNAKSWIDQLDSSHRLFDWLGGYLNQNMQQVGLLQYSGNQTPEIVWGADAATAPLHSERYVAVFKRLETGGVNGQDQAASRRPSGDATVRNKLLMDLFNAGQIDTVITQYQTAVHSQPNDAEAHYKLGNMFAWKGETNAAINEYQVAIRLRPDYADAYNNLGVALTKLGQTDEAIGQFQKAISFKPDGAEAHNNLGHLLLQHGRIDETITEFQAALRFNPDNAETHYDLASLLARQGRTDEAITQYQAALRLNPDDFETHYNLGILLAEHSQTSAAIGEFQETIRLQPDCAEAHYNLGHVLLLQSRIDETIAEFQAAIRYKPDYALAHNSLGVTLGAKGRIDEAISEFQAALRVKPDYASAQANLVKALAQKKQSEAPTSEPVK